MREASEISKNCTIGRGSYIDSAVVIGNRCKIQNNAPIYHPARLGDGVFIGPAVVLTHDRRPRAMGPEGNKLGSTDWVRVGVEVDDGAPIGAHAQCVAPVRVGAWAMVGAGSVVTKDVAPFSMVRGNPARHVGWVGRSGHPLEFAQHGLLVCPVTGETYVDRHGLLEQVSMQ